jgi:AcrR family transcriptional regulator
MCAIAATLKPRKSPVQARSVVTVETLHIATIQVLIQEGLSRCTTTRIAERAGTSVGSLYQYYPNRDALLAAVLEKHLEGIAVAVEGACQEHRGERLSEMASAFVITFLAAKLRDPEEAKALYAVAEERGGAVLAARMRSRIVAAVAAMLASAPGARFDDPAMIATIALGALVGPVQAVLKERAPAQFRARLERELVLLVTAYLQAHQFTPKRSDKLAAGAGLNQNPDVVRGRRNRARR